jgi:hypothetical protein
MLAEIEQFVNWVRRRNSAARTWRDYSYDLKQFADVVGDRAPGEISHQDIDRFVWILWSIGICIFIDVRRQKSSPKSSLQLNEDY